MKLTIRKFPDPILTTKTVVIKNPLNSEIQELILAMIEKMHAAKGVGLAANQIGKNLRLCVINTEGTTYVLINPKVTAKSKEKIISEEGCLSFPGEYFPVARHSEIQIRYIDEFGEAKKLKGQGLLSRAIQHEIDHLDGVVILDRIKKSELRKIQDKIKIKKDENGK